jgi:hypothetical protein
MLGHHPKHKTMMTRKKKVMTVKNQLVQHCSRVTGKVITVPRRRPILNQRKSLPKTTRRENKKKEEKESS